MMPAQANRSHFTHTRTHLDSYLLAFYLSALVIAGFLFASDAIWHWYVVPLLLCGTLIGSDAIDWLRGRLDLFDPIGIIGILGCHLFFLTPLLHVYWDYFWSMGPLPPQDWRDWLGGMALANALGLLLYRLARTQVALRTPAQPLATCWSLNRARFRILLPLALLISAVMQVWVYLTKGGITGYIASAIQQDHSFEGMGGLFIISESFPILLMMAFVLMARARGLAPRWILLGVALLAFFVLRLFFGGLRGSRSNTVWSLFWAVGMIHFWWGAITRRHIAVALVFLLGFMYFFGLYKNFGLEATQALQSAEVRADMEARSRRNYQLMLLMDLGRADVQAFLLYRLMTKKLDYELGWGRTYLGACSLLIPQRWWPERPPTKREKATDLQYGKGTYQSGFKSTLLYGIVGEAMVNFGPLAIPFAFLFFGAIIGGMRRWIARMAPDDVRILFAPFVISLSIFLLMADSDNLLFFVIKNAAFPLAVLVASVHRHPIVASKELG